MSSPFSYRLKTSPQKHGFCLNYFCACTQFSVGTIITLHKSLFCSLIGLTYVTTNRIKYGNRHCHHSVYHCRCRKLYHVPYIGNVILVRLLHIPDSRYVTTRWVKVLYGKGSRSKPRNWNFWGVDKTSGRLWKIINRML